MPQSKNREKERVFMWACLFVFHLVGHLEGSCLNRTKQLNTEK